MKKRLLSGLLAFAMLFGSAAALPEGVFRESASITASAEVSKATSGKCGENVKWSLKNGVLTISGSGAMYDYSYVYSPIEKRSDITSVVIKSGVTSIGESAFMKCECLTSVTIPKSVKSIGGDAFCMCSSLTNINIPTSVKSIGGMAFNSTKWLKNQREKNDFVVVNGILIDAAKCTGKVIIPNTVKVIGEGAFLWNGRVTSIKIPNSVKRIEEGAFFRCESLKTINIPESVTSIGDAAFKRCIKLTSVTIPNSVKSIGEEAFYGCTSLKSITIPSNVKSIGKAAFGYKRYEEHIAVEKVTGFTIYGVKGTAAEKYAKDNGFKFVALADVNRLAGANRYDSAAVISKTMHKTSDTVIVATGLTFNDALVAVPLASAYNAPLLLATERHITAQTEAELKRLKAKNVIFVSTNGAIGAKAKAEFKAAKYNMTYIEGKTSFETAAKVAKALQTKTKKAPTTIFFATDSAFADALSASPVAAIKNAPIMYLKNTGSIDKATADYLKSVKGKVKNAYVIGGDGVISNAMMKNVANALGLTVNKTVQRVAGKNRYETCVAVNNKFKSVLTGDGICVAKGLDFPDALAGGVYAAATKQALFLADGKKLQDFQNSYLKSKNAGKITVFGGTGAVPDDLVKLIAKASV